MLQEEDVGSDLEAKCIHISHAPHNTLGNDWLESQPRQIHLCLLRMLQKGNKFLRCCNYCVIYEWNRCHLCSKPPLNNTCIPIQTVLTEYSRVTVPPPLSYKLECEFCNHPNQVQWSHNSYLIPNYTVLCTTSKKKMHHQTSLSITIIFVLWFQSVHQNTFKLKFALYPYRKISRLFGAPQNILHNTLYNLMVLSNSNITINIYLPSIMK